MKTRKKEPVRQQGENPHPVRKTPKLPDFGDIKRKLTAEKEKKEKSKEAGPGDRDFTEKELQGAWNAFLDRLQKENRTSDHNALNQKFYLIDQHTICLEVINSFQLHMIEQLRTDLLEFLRERLNNRHILLKTKVVKPEGKKLIYTNSEKFKFLAEKYPLMNELKKRLGLETDF